MWDWGEDGPDADAEGDDVNWDRAKTAARDRDGSVRWRTIWRAIRGRRSDHDDMVPPFVGLLLVFVASVGALVLDGGSTLVDALAVGGLLLLVWCAIAVRGVGRRLDEYHRSDTDVESRLLADRYAAGDLTEAEFERRLDLLVTEGPEAVRRADDGIGSMEGDDGGGDEEDADPLATLRERFAAGEIDEEEYRSRLETLRETTAVDESSVAERERELDRE